MDIILNKSLTDDQLNEVNGGDKIGIYMVGLSVVYYCPECENHFFFPTYSLSEFDSYPEQKEIFCDKCNKNVTCRRTD